MIIAHIHYFNILAGYTGKKQETLQLADGTTGRQLVFQLAGTYGDPFRGTVLKGEAMSEHLRIFRNEQDLHGDSLDTPLENGDHILLFPAVAGG